MDDLAPRPSSRNGTHACCQARKYTCSQFVLICAGNECNVADSLDPSCMIVRSINALLPKSYITGQSKYG